MPQLKVFDIDPAAADADGIADDLGTGTSWSLSGDAEWLASSASDGLAHQLVITTAADEPGGNAPTLTITGTDADGNTITDTVTLPDSTTVETAKYFLTATSATASAATVGTMDIGWVDEISTPTYMLNRYADTGALVHIDISTEAMDLTIQVTMQDLNGTDTNSDQSTIAWINTGTAGLVTASSDVIGRVEAGVNALRVLVNSYTDTAEAQVYIQQEG